MTVAVVVQPIAETALLRVPRGWTLFPRDWWEALGYWHLIEAIKAQSNVVLYGPPSDIEWAISTRPEELRAVELRHDCEECREAREQAALLLEADKAETIAFVQFTQHYIYDAQNVPTEFVTGGVLARAEVDTDG